MSPWPDIVLSFLETGILCWEDWQETPAVGLHREQKVLWLPSMLYFRKMRWERRGEGCICALAFSINNHGTPKHMLYCFIKPGSICLVLFYESWQLTTTQHVANRRHVFGDEDIWTPFWRRQDKDSCISFSNSNSNSNSNYTTLITANCSFINLILCIWNDVR